MNRNYSIWRLLHYSKAEIWLRDPFLVDLNTIDNSHLVKNEPIVLKSK